MHGWWVLMGAVIAMGSVVTPRLRRRHGRRAQVARVRAELATWLPALNQPDGRPVFGGGVPPTFSSAASPRPAVRCRRTVTFGDLAPSITVRTRRAM